MTSYVYAAATVGASSQQRDFKVGFSCDPEARACVLTREYGMQINIVAVWEIQEGRRAANRVEQRCHSILRNYWVHGEWFEVSIQILEDAIVKAAIELGYQVPKTHKTHGSGNRYEVSWLSSLDRRRMMENAK